MFEEFFDHEGFAAAGVAPEVDAVDVVKDLIILLKLLKLFGVFFGVCKLLSIILVSFELMDVSH